MKVAGKRVLTLGSRVGRAKEALIHDAAVVESRGLRPEDRPQLELATWTGRQNCAGVVQLSATLEQEWDLVVLDGVRQIDLQQALELASQALVPSGILAVPRNEIPAELLSELALAPTEVPESVAPAPKDPNRNLMLHVHNVRRCGGTGNFVYDMACAFPEFTHHALAVNDATGDPAWIKHVSQVMRTSYAPSLTPELLDELNPQIVVLHATTGNKLAGEWPYDWLQDGGRRYVVGLHHIPTYPLLKADLDVFVSEYIKSRYQVLLQRMRQHLVLPPCTDLAPFLSIHRNGVGPQPTVTTAGKGCPELQQLAQEQLAEGWTWDHQPPGRLGAMPDYLKRFGFAVIWSGHQETWCRTVSEAMAAGCVTVAHAAGAVPEQITSGENGYLFQNGGELVELMEQLRQTSPVRLGEISRAGREWAAEHVGLERMRQALYPYLMQAVLGAA